MVSSKSFPHRHYSFSSRKRLKVSSFEHHETGSQTCIGDFDDVSTVMHSDSKECLLHGCHHCVYASSSCYNMLEDTNPALEMDCELNGEGSDVPVTSNDAGASKSVYPLPAFVTGWMYVNELNQMCGPYIDAQLHEGLSSGFLPGDLQVFPVLNQRITNPVPLRYFQQFPDHVQSGFMYLGSGISNALLPMPDSASATHGPEGHGWSSSLASNSQKKHGKGESVPVFPYSELSEDDSCWLFEDDEGKKHGPYNLLELYSWHCYGYLRDTSMIHHTQKDAGPFPLLSVLDAWRTARVESRSAPNVMLESCSPENLTREISQEISSQLHSAIVKAARRVVLHEIISNSITEFLDVKKTRGLPKLDIQTAETHPSKGEVLPKNTKSVGSIDNFQVSHAVLCRALFNCCMEVLWNAVCYDTVVEYSASWRKRKIWSGHSQNGFPSDLDIYGKKFQASVTDFFLPTEEISGCDGDCPPGFEFVRTRTENQTGIPDTKELILKPSEETIPSCMDCNNDDIKCFSESVENELHKSTNACLVAFVGTLVKEEVIRVANIREDGKIADIAIHGADEFTNPVLHEEQSGSTGIPLSNPKCASLAVANQLALKNTTSSFLASTFGKAHICGLNVASSPTPPGSEDGVTTLLPPLCKFHVSTSNEPHSRIKQYIALALCRQKLHDNAVGEWKNCFFDDLLQQHFPSFLAFAEGCGFDGDKGGVDNQSGESLKLCMSKSVGGCSPTGKYTYYRKKKTSRTKLASSLELVSPAESRGQLLESSREHISLKIAAKAAEAERSVSKHTKTDIYESQKKLSLSSRPLKGIAEGSRRLERSSARKTSCRRVKKTTQAVQGDEFTDNAHKTSRSVVDSHDVENETNDSSSTAGVKNSPTLNISKKKLYCKQSHDTKPSKLKRKHLPIGTGLPVQCTKIVKTENVSDKQALPHVGLENKKSRSFQLSITCPPSDGCARSSINGWEWHLWSLNASPSERAFVRGQFVRSKCSSSETCASQFANGRGLSARTNRAKVRNLLAAAEGAELLKATQLKVMKFVVHAINLVCLWYSMMSYSFIGKKKAAAFSTK
ncbi:unnamed protein product, partial [Linum tenue]